LEQALNALIRRHEILRTVYRLDAFPVQQILPEGETPLTRHDLAHLDADERRQIVANLCELEIQRPFDLARGPLLRAKLVRTAAQEHVLILCCHQIVTDAWSLGLFARELASLYASIVASAPNPLPPLEVQYADYAVWQQRWMADAALEQQIGFWKEQLAELAPPLVFARTEASKANSNDSTVRSLTIQSSRLGKLRTFNADENVTSFMTLFAAYNVLLAHLTGARDIVVGSPESGRRRYETESLLGCFVNMLPLRTRILPEDTFGTFLSRVRQTTVDAFANADIPFEKIQTLVRNTGETRSRLFQVWFGPIDALNAYAMGGLRVKPEPVFPPIAQFDLSCFLSEQPDSIRLFFEFKTSFFSADQINGILQCYEHLLTRFLENPGGSLNALLLELRQPDTKHASSPLMAI
jgi:hypothetical protein